MMVSCWEEKVSARLQIENVIKCLMQATKLWVTDVPAFLLASEAGIDQVMGLTGQEARKFLDKLYEVTSFGSQTLTFDANLQE